MLSFFKSRNLMKHINGTAIKPPVPTAFPPHYTPSDEEEMRYEKAEDRLEKYLVREGMVKTQVITSVSESLALMQQKKGNAKDLWEALTDEMMKKPKMVITSLQHQLRNMKCSEDHLDKSQDLYARVLEMGARISKMEFMDIILSSLPPSYETLMNAMITSLEECGCTVNIYSTVSLGYSSLNTIRRKL
jgi:hypothetical protein